jgi:hypothetical protein
LLGVGYLSSQTHLIKKIANATYHNLIALLSTQYLPAMAIRKYVKIGAIGLAAVAISVGIGIGVSSRNNRTETLNAAKLMTSDNDLPWCQEHAFTRRRELVVPGTEDIFSITDNLRKLGKTKDGVPTTPPTTPMPSSDDAIQPPTIMTIMVDPPVPKGTNSPSPSAAIVSIIIK